jgi:SAM-dependent methyltransferase
MEAMLAPIDEPLVAALHLDAPMRIADVACGGGGTTLAISRRAPQGSVVHGFDLAAGLIDAARARVPADERAVMFTVADVATTLPDPYERLVSRFGVMFFADPPGAFRNLQKWLVPGGRFAFAVWSHPDDNPWVTTLRDVIAEFVELPPQVPDAPGPFRYGRVDTLLELLRDARFSDVSVGEWRGQFAIGGGLPAPQAADFALAAFSVAEPLTKANEAIRERARRALTERFSSHLHDGVVRLNAAVHVVTGERK